MAIEIERKFVVVSDDWRARISSSRSIRQGYLLRTGPLSVRVRAINGSAFLTIKDRQPGVVRQEFEYAIPLEDAAALLAHCDQPLIEKVRHELEHGGKLWVVDEFLGFRVGLILAECELQRADEPILLPSWVGREVTDDPAYRNEAL